MRRRLSIQASEGGHAVGLLFAERFVVLAESPIEAAHLEFGHPLALTAAVERRSAGTGRGFEQRVCARPRLELVVKGKSRSVTDFGSFLATAGTPFFAASFKIFRV